MAYFEEDFEDETLDKWNTVGAPENSADQNHTVSGSRSCKILSSDAVESINKDFGEQNDGYWVQVWFYDIHTLNADKASMVQLWDGVTNALIGVYTDENPNTYTYRIGAAWFNSGINRTTGWHEFLLDFRDGVNCVGYIDKVEIFDVGDPDSFDYIALGNLWAVNDGIGYWDDVLIDTHLPGTADLLGIFEGQASQSLLGIFEVRHSDSEDLPCLFEIAQDSADLLGIFEAQQEDSENLLGIFDSQATQSLRGIFYVRQRAGWLPGWSNRVRFSIDSGDIAAALLDFPVSVYISAASGIFGDDITFIYDEIGANSKKIAITTDDGVTECYVEIEKWDNGAETSWLWLKVPAAAVLGDTYLYFYFDNTHADNDAHVGVVGSVPGQAVWDANFKCVLHLAETVGDYLDSTDQGNDATVEGDGVTRGNIQKIGPGAALAGTNDFLEIQNAGFMSGWDHATIEIYARYDVVGGAVDRCPLSAWGGAVDIFILYNDQTGATQHRLLFQQDPGGAVGRYFGDNPVVINTWYALAGSFERNVDTIAYQDGTPYLTPEAQADDPLKTINYDTKIGILDDLSKDMDGKVDEIRISNTPRTPAWLAATYESGEDDLLDWFGEEYAGTEDLLAIFEIGQGAEDLLGIFESQAVQNLLGVFEVGQGAEDLLGIFEIGISADSEDLFCIFDVALTPDSENLLGIFDIQQSGSAEFLGIFVSRQAGSAELLGIFEGQTSQNLLGIFTIRNSVSEELLGIFSARRDGSAELLGIFEARRSSSQDLLGIFNVQQAGSAELLGIFTIEGTGSENLLGIFDVRQAASAELLGIFEARRASSADLLGVFCSCLSGMESLFSIFTIRNSASAELLGQFVIGQGSQDLYCIFTAALTPGSANLFGIFTSRQAYEELLPGIFTIRGSSSQSLPSRTCVHTLRIAQDLDQWTEYDAGALLDHDCNDSWWNNVTRATQDTSLTTDVGAVGLGSDFFDEFILNMYDVEESPNGALERICVWAGHLAVAVQDYYAQNDFEIAALVAIATDIADEYQLMLIEKGGASDTMATKWPNFQDRYIVIYKQGTSLIANAYQDAGHTILEDSAEITLTADHNFRYVSIPMSWGQVGAEVSSGLVDSPIFGSMENLPGIFNIRRSASQDLPAQFSSYYSDSEDLLGIFEGQTSANLFAIFDARQVGSAELLGIFSIRRDGSQELRASFDGQGTVSLPAELVIRQTSSQDLAAGFDVNYWYHVSHMHINVGSIFAGTVDNTRADDGTELELNEIAAVPAFDYDFHFKNVPVDQIFGIRLNGWYEGNPAHIVKLQEWNFTTAGWDDVTNAIRDIPDTGAETDYVWMAGGPDYVSGGEYRLKIHHTNMGAAAGHFLHIDYLWLDVGFAESEDLLGELLVRQTGFENLPGEFIARHSASVELHGAFDSQVSLNLPGQFVARRSTQRNLFAVFVVLQGSEDLPGQFISRPAGSANLLGIMNIVHAVDLGALFEVQHSDSVQLLGGFSSRQPGSQDLFAVFSLTNAGTADLLGEFIVQHTFTGTGIMISCDPKALFNYNENIGTGFLSAPKTAADRQNNICGVASFRTRIFYAPDKFDYIAFGWRYRYPLLPGSSLDLRGGFYVMASVLDLDNWADLEVPGAWWNDVSGSYPQINPESSYLEVGAFNPNTIEMLLSTWNFIGTMKKYLGGTIVFDLEFKDSHIHAVSGSEPRAGLTAYRYIDPGTFGAIIYFESVSGQWRFNVANWAGDTDINITGDIANFEAKHLYRIVWETPAQLPPNGRVRLYIDDVLKRTVTTNVPDLPCSFGFGALANRAAALSRPGALLYAYSDVP